MQRLPNLAVLTVLAGLSCSGFLCACGGTSSSTNPDSPASGTTAQGDGHAGDGANGSSGSVDFIGLAHEHHLPSGLITAGEVHRLALEEARERGVTTIISLRTMSEPNAADERAMVEELGMNFVSIPVDGASGLTQENAQAVHEAIGDAEGTTVLHCASANRAGGIVALRAFFIQGATKSDALALGRSGGLTRLEDAVAAAIDAHCAENADAARCE